MRDFIHRVFLPLTLPLMSMVVIAIIVLNFSRVLLAVNKHTAAVIALGVAAIVLVACTYFSAVGRPGSAMNVAAPIGFIAVLSLGGVIALSSQHPKVHEAAAADTTPVAVTITAHNTNFDQKTLSASAGSATGKLGIAYKNLDGIEHTLVFEGVGGFKLVNASGNGATVKGAADLKPGTYTFYCDIAGHRAAGMEGKLTVTTPGGTGNAPNGSAASPTPAAAGTATTELAVTALDTLKFDPAAKTVPAGTVNITYTSNASSEHTLAIDGVADFKPLRVVKKGDTAKGTVKLAKGTYTLFCTIDSHRQAGMLTTLTVT